MLEKLLAEDKAHAWKRWERSVPKYQITQNNKLSCKWGNILIFIKAKDFPCRYTGFKKFWMCRMLANAGAVVTGYSLEAPTEPSLFQIANIEDDIHSMIGDIRDYASLKKAF